MPQSGAGQAREAASLGGGGRCGSGGTGEGPHPASWQPLPSTSQPGTSSGPALPPEPNSWAVTQGSEQGF